MLFVAMADRCEQGERYLHAMAIRSRGDVDRAKIRVKTVGEGLQGQIWRRFPAWKWRNPPQPGEPDAAGS
jgi:hypothetical protein